MAHPASALLRDMEFDNFLFAPIGEDRNGMLLSVVSALARLGFDPWQEAAELAGLPAQTAIERLASLIATLPDVRPASADTGTIAARLIALLPRRASSKIPRAMRQGLYTTPNSLAITNMNIAIMAVALLAFVILAGFLVGTQRVAASPKPAVQLETVHGPVAASATGTVLVP